MAFTGQYEGQQTKITLSSAGVIAKYECVTIAAQADGVCAEVASAGAQVTGIAQNAASAAGEAVSVCVMGVSKAVAGAAVTKGAALQADATGRVIAATTADEVLGFALEAAAAAGDQITVVVAYAGIY